MADTVSEPWLSVELNIVLYVKQYGRHHLKEKKKMMLHSFKYAYFIAWKIICIICVYMYKHLCMYVSINRYKM